MVFYWYGQNNYPGADAFDGAISAIMLYGGAAAGYRTMLDALIPASTVLREVQIGRLFCLKWHNEGWVTNEVNGVGRIMTNTILHVYD